MSENDGAHQRGQAGRGHLDETYPELAGRMWSQIHAITHPEEQGPAPAETCLAALAVLTQERALLDAAERALHERARAAGASWSQIAAAIGLGSRQAAEQRYLRRLGGSGDPATARARRATTPPAPTEERQRGVDAVESVDPPVHATDPAAVAPPPEVDIDALGMSPKVRALVLDIASGPWHYQTRRGALDAGLVTSIEATELTELGEQVRTALRDQAQRTPAPAGPTQLAVDDAQAEGPEPRTDRVEAESRVCPYTLAELEAPTYRQVGAGYEVLVAGVAIGWVARHRRRGQGWQARTPDGVLAPRSGGQPIARTRTDAYLDLLHARWEQLPGDLDLDAPVLTADTEEQEETHEAPATPADAEAGAVVEAPRVASHAPVEIVPVYLARLRDQEHLVYLDGERAGWLRPDPAGGWRCGDASDTRVLARTAEEGMQAAVTLAVRTLRGEHALPGIGVVNGVPRDARGRAIEPSVYHWERWQLMEGRIPAREDVLVAGVCVGWLQERGEGYSAHTLDGPVADFHAWPSREAAVTAGLWPALYAPLPAPELGAAARRRRTPRRRPRAEKPLCPYPAGAVEDAAERPQPVPAAEAGREGVYRLEVYDSAADAYVCVGYVVRDGRSWRAHHPQARRPHRVGEPTRIRARTRHAAAAQLLAQPGPLWGEPTDILIHRRPT